jgi:hypothetical protein
MNRDVDATPGSVRLDPEPEKTAAEAQPEKILTKERVEKDPPEAEAPRDPSDALDRMDRDQEQEEADLKFLEEYENLEVTQLVMEGYVEHKVAIIDEFVITIRTVTEDEDSEIMKRLEDLKGSQPYLSEQISRHTLAFGVVSVNGATFGEDADDRYTRIGKWAKPIKLAVWEEWLKLNKAVAMKIRGGKSGNSLERLLIGPALI